jgi:hypothetical protein
METSEEARAVTRHVPKECQTKEQHAKHSTYVERWTTMAAAPKDQDQSRLHGRHLSTTKSTFSSSHVREHTDDRHMAHGTVCCLALCLCSVAGMYSPPLPAPGPSAEANDYLLPTIPRTSCVRSECLGIAMHSTTPHVIPTPTPEALRH